MNQGPTPDMACLWLSEQLNELGQFRNANTRDAAFKQWRQNTLTTVQRIWPGVTSKSRRFRRVPFSPSSNRANSRVMRETFERGCAEAGELLREWISEIEAHGVLIEEPEAAAPAADEVEDGVPTLSLEGGTASRAPGSTREEEIRTIDLPEEPSPWTLPKAAVDPQNAGVDPAVESAWVVEPEVPDLDAWPALESAPPDPAPIEHSTEPAPVESVPIEISTLEPVVAEMTAIELATIEPTTPSPAPIQLSAIEPPEPTPPPKGAEAEAPTIELDAIEPTRRPTRKKLQVAKKTSAAKPASRAKLAKPRSRTAAKPKKSKKGLRLKDMLGLSHLAAATGGPHATVTPNSDPVSATAHTHATDHPSMEPADIDSPSASPVVPVHAETSTESNEVVIELPEIDVDPEPEIRTSASERDATDEAMAAAEIARIATLVDELGVPPNESEHVQRVLLELSLQLERGDLPWSKLREAASLVMAYPMVARHVLPVLVPLLDRAA